MSIEYEDLKQAARRARAELARAGAVYPGRGKVRGRPRTKEKADLLYSMALERMSKYPPRRAGDGSVRLPYFQRNRP